MAARKKLKVAPKTVRKNGVVVPAENISPEGSLRIDDLTRLKLLRLDAEGRAAHSEMVMTQKELAEYLKGIDPAGRIFQLQKHIQALELKKNDMKTQFETLIKETGELLKVDMSKISYDDESGVIHFPPAETPLKGE
jgi:hypothetical protein